MKKAKVKLSFSVTLNVQAESENAIYDWLLQTTPDEALRMAKAEGHYAARDYQEEIETMLDDQADVDVHIAKKEASL